VFCGVFGAAVFDCVLVFLVFKKQHKNSKEAHASSQYQNFQVSELATKR
jgi:hypothetical protein